MALKRHQHLDAWLSAAPLALACHHGVWSSTTSCGRSNGGEQTCLQSAKSRQSIRQRYRGSSIRPSKRRPSQKKIQIKNNKSCLFYIKVL
jgi:hypothetical protein